MIGMSDLQLDPKQFTRPAVCDTHGEYEERGGSLFGDPNRVIWWGCSTCNQIRREKEAQAEREREEKARQARLEARIKSAGIPTAFRTRTLENYRAETPEQLHALNTSIEYAENFWSTHVKTGRTLVFSGHPGTGKSHLALAIAQHVMKHGTALYRDVMDILRMVRATWTRGSDRSEEDVLRMLGEEVDLLVIDEIGVQRGTEDEQVILFDILNRRYRENRPTILLTNLGGKGLTEFLGPRLTDRLKEKAVFVPFRWDSYRANWVE